jgi:ATP-dependent protease HslVU (ClpYQ) ATPase subunit
MTDTTGKTSGTVTISISAKYEECETHKDKTVEIDTRSAVMDNVPIVYKRRITTAVGKVPSMLSVIYDHKRAQRELAFIKANQTLEEQRTG